VEDEMKGESLRFIERAVFDYEATVTVVTNSTHGYIIYYRTEHRNATAVTV